MASDPKTGFSKDAFPTLLESDIRSREEAVSIFLLGEDSKLFIQRVGVVHEGFFSMKYGCIL